MSIAVDLPDLRVKTAEYGWAYLLTVRADMRPHIVAVTPEWDGDALTMLAGRGSARNATERSSISLCYPPITNDGYSLIVDGTATVSEDIIRFAPTGAVLHRPAPPGFVGAAEGCGNDCVPVESTD